MDGEQKLEWGTTYSKYVDWLEEQLDQFCETQGCTVEEVFSKLKECMKGENSSFVRETPSLFDDNSLLAFK